MQLTEVVDDVDVMDALDIEELALRLLPWIADLRQREIGIATQDLRDAFQGRDRNKAERALREAWAWLEGQALLIESPQYRPPHQMRILSRKALALSETGEGFRIQSSRRVHKDSLNPCIREDVWALYHRGKFDTAVFEAMKAVEVAVRSAAGLSDKDVGVPLMRKAFDKNDGPLSDMTMNEAEREMRAHLFAGAIGSYKNPQSHRNVALDNPDETAEIIMLANHLLRIVDGSQADGP
jgi:uncharacterized protein (TIGR02391 family)